MFITDFLTYQVHFSFSYLTLYVKIGDYFLPLNKIRLPPILYNKEKGKTSFLALPFIFLI